MTTIQERIADFRRQNPLRILVFGPQLHARSTHEVVAGLQDKRKEVRAALEADGHYVSYMEDEVDPMQPRPYDNAAFQEPLIAELFDLLVILVHEPGSLAELGQFVEKPDLVGKMSLYVLDEHRDGYPRQLADLAVIRGATLREFSFPGDIDGCHLKGWIEERVRAAQIAKGL